MSGLPQIRFSLKHLFHGFILKTSFVLALPIIPRMGFQQEERRFFLIDAVVDRILFSWFYGLKVLDSLNAENMGGQSPGLIQILTFQKKLKKFPVIVFPADAPVLDLYQESCVLNNASNDIIGDLENFFTFAFPFRRIDKPVFQRIPFSLNVFPDTGSAFP